MQMLMYIFTILKDVFIVLYEFEYISTYTYLNCINIIISGFLGIKNKIKFQFFYNLKIVHVKLTMIMKINILSRYIIINKHVK